MIGIYERVSSVSQDFDAQHRDLEQWAKGKDARWFADKFTGTTLNRPQWERLWGQCCAGKIDTIVVWRLDRLARTSRGLITLRDELIARKINLISLRDSVDLATPSGRMFFTILASVAEFETEVRFERQLAGIAVAKAAGAYQGRSEGQFNKRTQELVDSVLSLRAAKHTIREIAWTTGLSRPTIFRILGTGGRP